MKIKKGVVLTIQGKNYSDEVPDALSGLVPDKFKDITPGKKPASKTSKPVKAEDTGDSKTPGEQL